MWDQSTRLRTVTLLLAVVTLGLLLSSAFHSRAQDDEGDVVAATQTPLTTQLPQLDTPTELRWEPDLFSWKKVENAPDAENYFVSYRIGGQDCSTLGYHLHRGDDELFPYDVVLCQNGRCGQRFSNVCEGGTLVVKAQDVEGYLDSSEATLRAHSSSRYKPFTTRCRAGFESYNETMDADYVEQEGGPPICTQWTQWICVSSSAKNGDAAASSFFDAVAEIGTAKKGPVPAAFFATISRKIAELADEGSLPIEEPLDGLGAYDRQKYWCINKTNPYPKPVLVQHSIDYDSRTVEVRWRGESTYYDIEINRVNLTSIEASAATRVRSIPDTYRYHLLLEPNETYTVRIRSNDEDRREFGQKIRANSEWSDPLDLGTPIIGLAAPTNFVADVEENTLCWDRVPDALRYRLWPSNHKIFLDGLPWTIPQGADSPICHTYNSDLVINDELKVRAVGNGTSVLNSELGVHIIQ